jgi:hypothetical protein
VRALRSSSAQSWSEVQVLTRFISTSCDLPQIFGRRCRWTHQGPDEVPKVTWLLWCLNNRSGDIAITFPERSSSVTDRKDSETRSEGIRILGLIVVIVSMAATIVVLISEDLDAAAGVAALVMIPLFILSIQLDSGRGQRIAAMTALVGVLALIATLVIVRPFQREPPPGPTEPPTPIETSPSSPTSPTTTQPSSPSTSQSQTKTTPPPPTPVGWVKAWKGPFRLGLRTGIDLDTAPASLVTGPDNNLLQGDLLYDDSDALSAMLVPYAWVAPQNRIAGQMRMPATRLWEPFVTRTPLTPDPVSTYA